MTTLRIVVLSAAILLGHPLLAAETTPLRFRITGIDTGGPNVKELTEGADAKTKKRLEKAARDIQTFAGKKQRVTCHECVLMAMLAVGEQIDKKDMRSESGVAASAGVTMTAPCDVPLEQDLAAIARAVAEADYSHKISPKVQFGLPLRLAKRDAGRAVAAVKKVEGVTAAGTNYDAKAGALWISLDPDAELTLAAIVDAVQGAGVEVATKEVGEAE